MANTLAWLQQQYTDTTQVHNPDRSTYGYTCDSSTAQVTPTAVNQKQDGTPRGTSECFLMGRVLNFNTPSSSGQTVEANYIIGAAKNPSATLPVNDFDALNAYNLTVYGGTNDFKEDYTLPWGASIVGSGGSSTPRSGAVIILQSPSSGTVHTFITNTAIPSGASINTYVTQANIDSQTSSAGGKALRTLCISSNGLFAVRDSVVLQPDASGQNDVTQTEAGNGC